MARLNISVKIEVNDYVRPSQTRLFLGAIESFSPQIVRVLDELQRDRQPAGYGSRNPINFCTYLSIDPK